MYTVRSQALNGRMVGLIVEMQPAACTSIAKMPPTKLPISQDKRAMFIAASNA
ncbi:hypothetical protein V1286_005129 [Bradyrhizobium algeriense]|uniref:Uncharacterized protein n=1 Tax=Bradyrhizobium algeriense TaxID=634784 RepID=A0ABU8BGJ9_9BRAD